MYQYFKDKETRLNIALSKVQSKLKEYKDTPQIEHKDWNDWHDLEDRLKERLMDNYLAYQSYLFEVNGVAVYDLIN